MQSADIAQGVDVGGAGDQGMMFGYACDETDLYVPKAMAILQEFSRTYEAMRKKNPDLFYADGKAQITGYYDDEFRLTKIKTFTISYQNSETDREFTDHLIKTAAEMICYKYKVEVEEFLINPTGKFLIGSFEGDAGLTGRKIVVDSYQSFAPVGGGAFSGKDPTKVDRSGAYKARQLAIRTLKKHNLKWCEIQLSYAIGKAEPLAIYIDSDKGNLEVPAEWYQECTPANMINDLKLRQPIYEETACFGHFGCPPDAFGRVFSWEN
jgi:S-adenosylmethionine synthetase